MAHRVEWSPRALADVENIADYIASVKAQPIDNRLITAARVREAFADLLAPNAVSDKIGPSIKSGSALFLFNLYNYTAVAFPTRIRAVAFAWTDGLGHLGAWAGVTLLGPLYQWGPNHLGWILFIIIPGALLPALLIKIFEINQSDRVLEEVAK